MQRFKGRHLFPSCPVNSWFESDTCTQTLSEMEVPHRDDNSGKFEILYIRWDPWVAVKVISMHMTMVWTTLKPLGPPIAHFLATSFRSLLRNLAPPTMRRSLRLSLGACHLLKQTTAFAHLCGGLYPRASGPAVELESPILSDQRWLMFAKANINGVARCRDSSSNSVDHTIVICKGNYIKPPPQEVPHKNTKV